MRRVSDLNENCLLRNPPVSEAFSISPFCAALETVCASKDRVSIQKTLTMSTRRFIPCTNAWCRHTVRLRLGLAHTQGMQERVWTHAHVSVQWRRTTSANFCTPLRAALRISPGASIAMISAWSARISASSTPSTAASYTERAPSATS